MKSLAPYYQNRMALVDLASGTIETTALPHDILKAGIGGAALATALAPGYPDAILLATGPLTGSFAPASGLMTATVTANGKTTHLALPQGHGAWLRRSGFDLLVITQAATKPCVIRCAKGDLTLVKETPLAQLPNRNALREALLRLTDDGLAGLLLADAHPGSNGSFTPSAGGENGTLPGAPVLGAAMAAKNLLALSLEGGCALPPIPVPLRGPLWQKVTQNVETHRDALLRELELSSGSPVSLPAALSIKSAACYHCPSPCLAWIPGFSSLHLLAGDHVALAAAVKSCGENAGKCMAACDARGADISAAAPLLAGLALGDSGQDIDSLLPDSTPALSPAPPPDEAEKAGLILGICPRLIRRKGLTAEDLAQAAGAALAPRLADAASLLTQEVYI